MTTQKTARERTVKQSNLIDPTRMMQRNSQLFDDRYIQIQIGACNVCTYTTNALSNAFVAVVIIIAVPYTESETHKANAN